MKKYILTGIAIFAFMFIYITIDAARIDAGSWTNPYPGGGHNMSMSEAVLYNIPLGISAGLFVSFAALFLVYVGKTVYRELQYVQNERKQLEITMEDKTI